jgi:hypothetical protein
MKTPLSSYGTLLLALASYLHGVQAHAAPAEAQAPPTTAELAPAPASAPVPAPASSASGPGVTPTPPPTVPSPTATAAAAGPTAAAAAAAGDKPTSSAEAQVDEGPPLLLGRKKQHVGGYGGMTIAYTHMLHRDGALIGGQGAVLLEHRLSIGGAGYGFTRSPDGPPLADGRSREYVTGYGGFLLRYAAYTNFPIYASLGVLLGGGGIVLAPHEHDDDDDDVDNDDVEGRGYFVAQPDLSLHLNPTRWLRFGLTVGYRFASAVNDFDYDAGAVSGVLVGGHIEAGAF